MVIAPRTFLIIILVLLCNFHIIQNISSNYGKWIKSCTQNCFTVIGADLLEELTRPTKRGRPRKDQPRTIQRLGSKITEAIDNRPGQPILYASTTKGTMKLVVDGHHFRYSFRKGKYSIFQCCYKENKEECLVRVVTDQKLVYPLDGEHIHFIQATDKSVTSVKFTPGEEVESEFVTIKEIQNVEQTQPEQEHVMFNIEDSMPTPIQTTIKNENIPSQESLEFTAELANEKSTEDDKSKEVTSSEEFREKIKKRLQKALLGKKKPV